MDLALIVAVSENGVIGSNGTLPWRIPEDMKRFKDLTEYHPVIMGRKTYESIPPRFRPLKKRANIVLMGQKDYNSEGIYVAHTLSEALMLAESIREPFLSRYWTFVIGGSSIYQETLPLAKRLEVTRVHREFDGDTFFPEIVDLPTNVWKETHIEPHEGFSFVSYRRV